MLLMLPFMSYSHYILIGNVKLLSLHAKQSMCLIKSIMLVLMVFTYLESVVKSNKLYYCAILFLKTRETFLSNEIGSYVYVLNFCQ